MRVRMRLSQETKYLLNHYKAHYKEVDGDSVTFGWLVNLFTEEIMKKEDISWSDYKLKDIKIDKSITSDDNDYNTTLNLRKPVVDQIDILQNKFIGIFEVKRVHKAFVVRMIVKAYYIYDQENKEQWVKDNDKYSDNYYDMLEKHM